jgi:hypothetical protein
MYISSFIGGCVNACVKSIWVECHLCTEERVRSNPTVLQETTGAYVSQ